jgi:predicted nucleotidyltransferase
MSKIRILCQMKIPLPETLEVFKKLEQNDDFLGAFIFGSFARAEQTEISDIDIKVVVKDGLDCTSINHPIIDGRKTDLSFNNLKTIIEGTEKEINERQRIPMIAESIILFDKTGELKRIKSKAIKAKPKKPNKKEMQWIQFMIYHLNDKVERFLKTDPASAMLSMHIGINDLLKFHYQFNQKWWLSSKKLLSDLRKWDPKMTKLLDLFTLENNIQKKFKIWTQMIDYILQEEGGRQKITENNCTCSNCKRNLELLIGN